MHNSANFEPSRSHQNMSEKILHLNFFIQTNFYSNQSKTEAVNLQRAADQTTNQPAISIIIDFEFHFQGCN